MPRHCFFVVQISGVVGVDMCLVAFLARTLSECKNAVPILEFVFLPGCPVVFHSFCAPISPQAPVCVVFCFVLLLQVVLQAVIAVG